MHPRKRNYLRLKARQSEEVVVEEVKAPAAPVVEKAAPKASVDAAPAPQARSSKKASATKKSVVTLKKK